MKKLKLQNSSYRTLISNFKEWLDVLGYAEKTVNNLPVHLQEFFYYLEQRHIKTIDQITTSIIKDYYHQLKCRPNEKRQGALSRSSLNRHQQALKRFREYLSKHGGKNITLQLRPEKIDKLKAIDILSPSQIKQLFKATQYSSSYPKTCSRDKAMLVLLYSCGLRRNEAINITLKDILYDQGKIHVRKGKNYKERFVPINDYNLEILEEYTYNARLEFNNYRTIDHLLIGLSGKPLHNTGIQTSLQRIVQATGDTDIIEKQVTPHKLRHAIATHLLQAGMDIEDIQQFLGHRFLETTQIYTHIVKQL